MPLPFSSFQGSRPILCALVLLVVMLASLACVKRTRIAISSNTTNEPPNQITQKEASDRQPSLQKPPRVNLNTASTKELEALPGIGKGLAERIVEHREQFGPFRRTEHLIIVRGISDKRFRALRDFITVD